MKQKNKKENINNIIKNYKDKILLDDLDLLNKFLEEINKNKSYEVVKNGEVMTPAWLINEILDKLDEIYKKENNKSIFEEKYTWFDPCCGMGNFHIEIYKRLIKYHSKDEIINKMFYGCEINSKNVFLYKMIFGKDCNIINGDSLKLEDKKYDIIIGNPPYNCGTKNTGNTIYQEFIKKFIKNYKKYFSFITPPGWRKPNTEKCKNYGLYDLIIKDNHLNYLSIHNIKEGLKTFNAGTRYDWYIIDKDIKNKESIIYGIDKKEYKIKCNEWEFLPNGYFDSIKNILNFKLNNNLEVIYSRNMYSSENIKKNKSLSKTKNNIYKYTIIYSINQKEIRYLYSNENKGMIGEKKIIFNKINVKNNLNDINGEYGLSELCIGIKYIDNIEGQKIIDTLNNHKFQTIMDCFYYSHMTFDWRIFTYFKKDFYKYI